MFVIGLAFFALMVDPIRHGMNTLGVHNTESLAFVPDYLGKS